MNTAAHRLIVRIEPNVSREIETTIYCLMKRFKLTWNQGMMLRYVHLSDKFESKSCSGEYGFMKIKWENCSLFTWFQSVV